MTGQVILMRSVKANQPSIQLDLTSLPQGMYIIEFRSKDPFPYTSKIIKN
jgi:hypothetical protein